ncbi:MAG: hypothetical protein SGPRY_010710, partial [Prymnesium sp.]
RFNSSSSHASHAVFRDGRTREAIALCLPSMPSLSAVEQSVGKKLMYRRSAQLFARDLHGWLLPILSSYALHVVLEMWAASSHVRDQATITTLMQTIEQ